MENEDILKYQKNEVQNELQHSEYFYQFEEVIEKRFFQNEEMTLYRTCQSVPCSEDDKQARIFWMKNGQEPVVQVYSEEELEMMDDDTKYHLVTKGALSFNTSPEAAIASAKAQDEKLKHERGGKKKSATYRAKRGYNVSKFDFPAGIGLVSETKYEHLNLITYRGVDIEDYRDKDFEDTVDYDG